MVIFNGYTVFAIAVGVMCGGAAYSLSKSASTAMVAAALGIAAYDLYVRLRDTSEDVPLINPLAGAHLTFIPAWICALLGLIAGGLVHLGWL